MNNDTIYIITNIFNGKTYIGKTEREFDIRLLQHLYDTKKGSNLVFHRAIRKYGMESFHIECLQVSDKLANLWEKHLIKRWNSKTPNGYNLTDGGDGGNTRTGMKHSEESKRKMSVDRKNKNLGPENPNYGNRCSKNPLAKPIVLIHPDSTEEYFGCIKTADTKYNFSGGNLSRVAQGKRKQHKGFKCRYTNKDEKIYKK